jgi:predicted alpha/beta hydrolase family esterase
MTNSESQSQSMKQVIIIHGGTTFSDYDTYLKSLTDQTLNVDRYIYRPMWKELLQDNLGSDYQVLAPSMPNKTNARYNEWRLWFESLSSIISDDCVLVGHSLGGVFLAKYLSENTFARRIKATVLIAAPYDDESIEDLTDFKIEKLSERFAQQAGRIIFYNGLDDPVIPMSEQEKYKKDLPSAEFNTLPAPDHFVRVDFPEFVSRLKELWVTL